MMNAFITYHEHILMKEKDGGKNKCKKFSRIKGRYNPSQTNLKLKKKRENSHIQHTYILEDRQRKSRQRQITE